MVGGNRHKQIKNQARWARVHAATTRGGAWAKATAKSRESEACLGKS